MNKITYIILMCIICTLLHKETVQARTLIFDLESGTIYEEVVEPKVEPVTTIYDLYTDDEILLLFRTVETETHGADYESKKNIASVILNRQEKYKKNLEEIITSPNQFAYSKTEITVSTVRACEDALNNRGNVSEALYFRSDICPDTWNGRPFLYTDNLHNFY